MPMILPPDAALLLAPLSLVLMFKSTLQSVSIATPMLDLSTVPTMVLVPARVDSILIQPRPSNAILAVPPTVTFAFQLAQVSALPASLEPLLIMFLSLALVVTDTLLMELLVKHALINVKTVLPQLLLALLVLILPTEISAKDVPASMDSLIMEELIVQLVQAPASPAPTHRDVPAAMQPSSEF